MAQRTRGNSETDTYNRRTILTTGATLAALGVVGTAPAAAQSDEADASGKGRGKGKNGRPSATVSSGSCGSITVERNTTGPDEAVTFTARSGESSGEHSIDVGRGETSTIGELKGGEWSVESSHSAIVVGPSSVTVEPCPSATLTISNVDGQCGVFKYERNDAGPERVYVIFIIDTGDTRKLIKYAAIRGETRTYQHEIPEGATVDANIVEGTEPAEDGITWDEVEILGTPVNVEPCDTEPEGATLTLSSPECGVLAVERNDAGPEFVILFLEIDKDGAEGTHLYETAAHRGSRKEFDFGYGATITADVDVGSETADDGITWDEIEIIGNPTIVEPCE